MTLERREPFVVKLGRGTPLPPSDMWIIEVQQPSILRFIMVPLSGLQAMLKTDCEDVETLQKLLRASLGQLETKVAEIATGDCDEDFGITLVTHDNLKRSVDETLTELARDAVLKRAAKAVRDHNKSATNSDASGYVQKPYDIRPIRDPLRAFPEFAALREKWGLRMTSLTIYGWCWTARLEGEFFDLVLGESDRGEGEFDIRPKGSNRDWEIPTVLREMGLWGTLRERVDHRKLARILEENLPAVLIHIAEKESSSGSA
jgi:hypothetical protein